jgi:hypothetical protein
MFLSMLLPLLLPQNNDPRSFDSLHISMITLYTCATLEGWTDVMYTNIYGCDKYGYEGHMEQCLNHGPEPHGVWAMVFFTFFAIIAAFITINLFIGVITTSMSEAQRELDLRMLSDKRVEALVLRHKLARSTVELTLSLFVFLDFNGNHEVSKEDLVDELIRTNVVVSVDELNSRCKAVDDALNSLKDKQNKAFEKSQCVAEEKLDFSQFLQLVYLGGMGLSKSGGGLLTPEEIAAAQQRGDETEVGRRRRDLPPTLPSSGFLDFWHLKCYSLEFFPNF